MSFYSKLATMLSELKLSRKDFPIKIKKEKSSNEEIIWNPEELMLIDIKYPNWILTKTKIPIKASALVPIPEA